MPAATNPVRHLLDGRGLAWLPSLRKVNRRAGAPRLTSRRAEASSLMFVSGRQVWPRKAVIHLICAVVVLSACRIIVIVLCVF